MPGPFCFAWVGGTIQEQTTLITNGTTHGARFETMALVGDTNVGQRQLINVASSQGLESGTLYSLSGSGVSSPTYFIYDDNVLAGFPGSINLTSVTASDVRSGTFEATKAVSIGVALGALTTGSSEIFLFDVPDLVPGLYGISGSGIGETNVPIGSSDGTSYTTGGGILTVGSAFLNYLGGGVGTMQIIAASPHNRISTTLPPVITTTYAVAMQDVRASASGTFPIELSGFPVADPYAVTNIPSSALMGLAPGLVYNVSGNGIQVGSTFVAPSSGTAMQLDLFATSSQINAILTIAGPRTTNAPFDSSVHNRFDEEILSFEISQEEGDFATLHIDLKNPLIGLLGVGRNLWCWLSWDQAWTPGGSATPDLVPLFNGRLVGVPQLQAGEVVKLEFLARPDDYNYQKLAWADSLKVLPYYDPIWFATTPNPDAVLEAYSMLFNVDRASLTVSLTDILDGDGDVNIGEDQAIYDRFSLTYQQPPLVAVTVSGTVTWQQRAEGVIDITQDIVRAFAEEGGAPYGTGVFTSFVWGISTEHYRFPNSQILPLYPNPAPRPSGGALISVMLGDGLKNSWPKAGTSIGGGWSLTTHNDYSGRPLNYIMDATWLPTGQTYTVTYSGSMPVSIAAGSSTDQTNVAVATNPVSQLTTEFPIDKFYVRMNIEYNADRKRTETVTAVLTAAVQQELSDPAETDRDAIALTSELVDKAVDANGGFPIGNVAYRSYLQTARGAQSFEYLMLLARAKMRARARAVDITFAVDWATAIGITLRHRVALTDRRLPGGVAVGKVKSYKLSATGGTMLGEFTIGCVIGTGDSFSPQAGTNSYVVDGYVNPPYQRIAGAQIALGGGDLYYQTLDDFVIKDDGLDFTNLSAAQVVNECRVTNGLTTQIKALEPWAPLALLDQPFPPDPRNTIKDLVTEVTLDLKPVQGQEFHTDFFPAVTPLVLPRTIDLSATSGERSANAL